MARGQAMVRGQKLTKTRRFVDVDAGFLKEHAGGAVEDNFSPAPSQWLVACSSPESATRRYPSMLDVARDPRGHGQRRDEGAAGIRVQLHPDGLAALLSSVSPTSPCAAHGAAAKTRRPTSKSEKFALDNAALADRGNGDVTVGLHMCRGNARSRWHAEGSYEPIAEKAFAQLNVDRFLLEYETRPRRRLRAPALRPARQAGRPRPDQQKAPELEQVDDLRRRIEEASKYIPIDQLAVSPQCGFASTAARQPADLGREPESWSSWRR